MTEQIKDKQFDGQRDGEQLLFVFRRHIIAMRKGFYLLLGSMTLGSLPFLIWQDNLNLLWVFVGGFIFGLMLFFYIVTDQRIRQITQHGFFGKDVIELKLSKIQNISYSIPGFSGEMFKFGTIVIQTFVGDLVIKNVEHPDKIYNKLQDAVEISTKKEDINEESIEP